ncbi:MAG: hypothetical protein K6C08_06280 [Oscillospiraceae bacterium]|nr:hypothetical protein [Oscillospiraceae bacterium]
MFSKDKTKKVNGSESVEETEKPSEEAGMELTDDDMDHVTGGVSLQHIGHTLGM